jgi:hypothetical protein
LTRPDDLDPSGPLPDRLPPDRLPPDRLPPSLGSVDRVSDPSVPADDDRQAWDEQLWRRPATPADETPTAPAPPPPAYTGPPRAHPDAAAWRPQTVIQVPPARQLPPQDDAEIDAREHQARTVTYGVGLIAAAIAVIVLIVLCGRVLF